VVGRVGRHDVQPVCHLEDLRHQCTHCGLVTYLQACADNGNAAPVSLNAFLPWMMDDNRLAFMRATLGYQGQGQKQNGSAEREEVATTAPTLDIETIDSS